jgi:hypothetical protein
VLAADRDAHRLADHLVRVDLVILDELGYLPLPISGRTRRRGAGENSIQTPRRRPADGPAG